MYARSLSAEFPNDNSDLHAGTIWMSDETCGEAKPQFQNAPEPEPVVMEMVPAVSQVAIAEIAIRESADADALDDDGDGSDIEIVDYLDMPLRALEIVPPPLESGTRSLGSLAASLVGITGEMLTTDDLESFLNDLDDDRIAPLESGMAPRMPTIMPLARCGLELELDLDLEPGLTSMIDEKTESPEEVETNAPPPPDSYATLVSVLATIAEEAGSSGEHALLAEFLGGDPIASAWRSILRGESDDFAACGSKSLDEWASEALARFLNAPAKAAAFRRELRARGVAAYGLVMEAA